MQIQVNTDHNIVGDEKQAALVESTVRDALERFAEQITRVEVHLSDENSAGKTGPADIRCLMEARLAGRQPTAVSDQAPTIDQAVAGAAEKMKRSLESTLGRVGQR